MHQLLTNRHRHGLFAESLEKVEGVLPQMLASIEACRRAGEKIGLGTDIFGTEFHHLQASESRYRGEVDKPIDVLRSATRVNAEIAQVDDRIGTIAPDYAADLVLWDSNQLDDLEVFEC